MQMSASRETTIFKALNIENSYSMFKFNNAGDGHLSPCPAGDKLEKQSCITALYKGITIICVLRLDLNS